MNILLLNRGTSYPSSEIQRAAQAHGHTIETCHYDNISIRYHAKSQQNNQSQLEITTELGTPLTNFDWIIPRGPLNFRHIAQIIAIFAKNYGIKMLNLESLLKYPIFDKSVQYALLSEQNLPIIETILDTKDSNFKKIADILGTPFVYKYTKGSEGKHVYKISTQEELDALPFREKRLNERFYIAQKYQPARVDFRIIVVDNNPIGVMKRSAAAEGEFRANFSLGGNVEKAELTEELRKLSTEASKATECDYVGVDIMYWQDVPYILEVNRYCHFDGFDKANNTHVAEHIISYIESKK